MIMTFTKNKFKESIKEKREIKNKTHFGKKALRKTAITFSSFCKDSFDKSMKPQPLFTRVFQTLMRII